MANAVDAKNFDMGIRKKSKGPLIASPDGPSATDPTLMEKTLLARALRRCLPHLGLEACIADDVAASASLEVGNVPLFLHMVPVSNRIADTSVAVMADLGIEFPDSADKAAALRWNICATVSDRCALGCTESGALVLMQTIDICGMDDLAFAAVLKRTAFLARDAQAAIGASKAFLV